MSEHALIIRQVEQAEYIDTWHKMRDFTLSRDDATIDELWLLQHPPVFTQGQAGKAEHILQTSDIPVIQTDRGGQVTYHGPGQLMVYPLINLKRLKLNVKTLVCRLEQTVIDLLQELNISAERKAGAPGIYVQETKIASIGLRVRRGACYHGASINVDVDLAPFSQINPCGFSQLEMSNINHFCPNITVEQAKQKYIPHFLKQFGFSIFDSSKLSL